MTIKFTTATKLNKAEMYVSDEVLSNMTCGLYRACLTKAPELMPEFSELWNNLPQDVKGFEQDYEVDIKIHMLLAGQFPCIPNWHCDFVPRVNGKTDYSSIALKDSSELPKMYLWLSNGPLTVFPKEEIGIAECDVKHLDHSGVSWLVNANVNVHEGAASKLMQIKPQHWYSFDQMTPHQGVKSSKFQWRVFARIAPKSITPPPVEGSNIRRHCQVYLDSSNFSW